MFCDRTRYLGRDVSTALRDPADHTQHLCFWGVLQHIGCSPRIERTAYVHIPFRTGHHHHDRSRAFLADRNKRIRTARARKSLIHNRQVGVDATKLRKSILRILRLTDKEQIRLRLDDHTQAFAKNRVVIDQQYPYGFRWWHTASPIKLSYRSLNRATVKRLNQTRNHHRAGNRSNHGQQTEVELSLLEFAVSITWSVHAIDVRLSPSLSTLVAR